eukprot:CFRG5151T1
MGNKNSKMEGGVDMENLRRDSEGVIKVTSGTPFLHSASRDMLTDAGSIKGSLNSPSSNRTSSTPKSIVLRNKPVHDAAGVQKRSNVQKHESGRSSSVADDSFAKVEMGEDAMNGTLHTSNTINNQPMSSNDLRAHMSGVLKRINMKALVRSISQKKDPKTNEDCTSMNGDSECQYADNGTERKVSVARWNTVKYGSRVDGTRDKSSNVGINRDENQPGDWLGKSVNAGRNTNFTSDHGQDGASSGSSYAPLSETKTQGLTMTGKAGSDAVVGAGRIQKQLPASKLRSVQPSGNGVAASHSNNQFNNCTMVNDCLLMENSLAGMSMNTNGDSMSAFASGCDEGVTYDTLGGESTGFDVVGSIKEDYRINNRNKAGNANVALPKYKQYSQQRHHAAISNHHIYAGKATNGNIPNISSNNSSKLNTDALITKAPLRKTQSSMGFAQPCIQHISDRVPSKDGKDTKKFYAQSEPGLSSAKITQNPLKNKTRRKSEKISGGAIMFAKASNKPTEMSLVETSELDRPMMFRSNSCSTLFVDQTVSKPDLDNILRCMAIAFHLQFLRLQRAGISDVESGSKSSFTTTPLKGYDRRQHRQFSDSSDALFLDGRKHFSRTPASVKNLHKCESARVRSGGFDSLATQKFTKNVHLPDFPIIFDEMKHPLTSGRVLPNYKHTIPSANEMYEFLRAFFSAALLKAEVAIVAMVYISRLEDQAAVTLQPANWKRVLLGASMLASKVWDDQAVWNADFCTVLPDVSVEDMNTLERVVLEKLTYDVSVTPSQYVQHYFHMRQYGLEADLHDGRGMLPLTVTNCHQMDAISKDSIIDLSKKTKLLQTHSSEDLLGDANIVLM